MITNSKGYSLIEVMIVLLILTAVTGITLVSYQSLSENREAEQFFELLKEDLFFAQQTALVNHQKIALVFDTVNKDYSITMKTNKIRDRSYPEDMTISGNLRLEYKSNGNLSTEPGDLVFRINGDKYTVSVQFGKGRVAIEKQ